MTPSSSPPPPVKVEAKKPFVFISTFKWEMRKGWDKLVHAYLQVRYAVISAHDALVQ